MDWLPTREQVDDIKLWKKKCCPQDSRFAESLKIFVTKYGFLYVTLVPLAAMKQEAFLSKDLASVRSWERERFRAYITSGHFYCFSPRVNECATLAHCVFLLQWIAESGSNPNSFKSRRHFFFDSAINTGSGSGGHYRLPFKMIA